MSRKQARREVFEELTLPGPTVHASKDTGPSLSYSPVFFYSLIFFFNFLFIQHIVIELALCGRDTDGKVKGKFVCLARCVRTSSNLFTLQSMVV